MKFRQFPIQLAPCIVTKSTWIICQIDWKPKQHYQQGCFCNRTKHPIANYRVKIADLNFVYLIKKYFDIIPEDFRNLITGYSFQLEELESELKTKVNDIIAKIKAMTYYDLELYYPSIYKILLDRENKDKKSEKKILEELERKINETINQPLFYLF